MLIWFVTILIAFFVARFAINMDIKHNNSWVLKAMSDTRVQVVIILLVLLFPFINIGVSFVLLIMVVYERLDTPKNAEEWLRKIFFIKEKEGKK